MLTLGFTLVTLFSTCPEADSVSRDSVRMQEVVVVADPWQTASRNSIRSEFTFTRAQLRALAPWQAREVLSLVPGVFIRDYGGTSALQTVSFRGSSSSQALVLIDGARLSSAQHGSADISMIPMRFVSSVEASRGGSSALYGANAVSGVIDMRLRLPTSDHIRLSSAGGSFDQWALSAGVTSHIGNTTLGMDVERLGSMGSFPFVASQFGSLYEVNRQNNDVRSTRAIFRFEGPEHDAATVLIRSQNRGVPGAVVQGNITQARARMQDDDVIGIWSVGLTTAQPNTWKAAGSVRYLDQTFQDPDATIVGSQGIDVRYIQRDVTQSLLSSQYNLASMPEGRVHLAGRFDVSYADIRGKSLQGPDGMIHRASASTTIDARFDSKSHDSSSLYPLLQTAIRAEYFTDIGMVVSPLVGASLELSTSTQLRALWSYNLRPPSFNELYYLNYGTKDLLPERSSTIEVGLHVQPTDWLDADFTTYAMNTRNLIVSVPVSPVITSAQNVGSARTFGLEATVRAQAFDERLRLQYSYAFMDARDATQRPYLDGTYLPYAPAELISGLVMWTDRIWYVSATVSHTGFRYHSSQMKPAW